MPIPKPPADAGPAGRKLWRDVLSEYALSGADLAQFRHAVEMEDQLDQLKPWLRLGPIIKDAEGRPMVNPASVQHRLLTDSLGKVQATIGVIGDANPADIGTRSQHRGGARGVYTGLRAVNDA